MLALKSVGYVEAFSNDSVSTVIISLHFNVVSTHMPFEMLQSSVMEPNNILQLILAIKILVLVEYTFQFFSLCSEKVLTYENSLAIGSQRYIASYKGFLFSQQLFSRYNLLYFIASFR